MRLFADVRINTQESPAMHLELWVQAVPEAWGGGGGSLSHDSSSPKSKVEKKWHWNSLDVHSLHSDGRPYLKFRSWVQGQDAEKGSESPKESGSPWPRLHPTWERGGTEPPWDYQCLLPALILCRQNQNSRPEILHMWTLSYLHLYPHYKLLTTVEQFRVDYIATAQKQTSQWRKK